MSKFRNSKIQSEGKLVNDTVKIGSNEVNSMGQKKQYNDQSKPYKANDVVHTDKNV